MTAIKYTVQETSWQKSREALRHVREQVFIVEQKVPKELEWDDKDAHSAHVIALDETGHAIGTGRLLASGQIGRMAVLAQARGFGVGSEMLEKLIEIAKSQGQTRLFLHAQSSAVAFYGKYQFKSIGEPFMEAGIPHLSMERWL